MTANGPKGDGPSTPNKQICPGVAGGRGYIMYVIPIARCAFAFGLIFIASATSVHAQSAEPKSGITSSVITVPAGINLRISIERGSRLHEVGQRVEAKLSAPVYIGETLAVPRGTRVEGRVTRIVSGSHHAYISRLVRGDLTPPRTGEVNVDTLILADGTRIRVITASSQGLIGVHKVRFIPKDQKPGIKVQISKALKPFSAPHKLQRLGQAAFSTLPYHPNYLDEGTTFDVSLTHDLILYAPVAVALDTATAETDLLHLKLISNLNSSSSELLSPVVAEVTQPFYDSKRVLLYPVGSRIEGNVTAAQAARWLHKNGSLRFKFTRIAMPGRGFLPLYATLNGLDVSGDQDLAVSAEGALRAQSSRLGQVAALGNMINPSVALGDSSLSKTAFDRGGLGAKGTGFIGAGAAQTSANTAIGFGYGGAAIGLYGAFIAKGTDIILPANTPMSLRVESPDLSNVILPGTGSLN
jgi:hypothetical protein